MKTGENIYEHIGTPAYLAPEIIKENGYQGFQADVWSLGVLSYIALTGEVPFKGNSIKQLNEEILTKKLRIRDYPFEEKFKRVLQGMLRKKPKQRITVNEVAEILDISFEGHLGMRIGSHD